MKQFLLFCLILVASFGFKNEQQSNVVLRCVYQEQPIQVGDSLNLQNHQVQLENLKFYICDIKVKYTDGQEITFPKHQLINLEDQPNIQIPNFKATGIVDFSFGIGVDSTTTMQGVFDGDLDPAKGMFWTWQSGYVNFKVEWASADQETFFHIGGFANDQNSFRTIHLKSNPKKTLKSLDFDLKAFADLMQQKGYSGIMSPGKQACDIADHYSNFFKLNLQ